MNDVEHQLEIATKLVTARTEDLRVALARLSEIANTLEALAKLAREPLCRPSQ
jgi:hypothetical protein